MIRLKTMVRPIVLVTLLFSCAQYSFAKSQRSTSVLLAFKRQNPCPATEARRGACPGYVIDHIIPLCAGGPDALGNLQWQTRADSLLKDREDRRQCRALKRQGAALR